MSAWAPPSMAPHIFGRGFPAVRSEHLRYAERSMSVGIISKPGISGTFASNVGQAIPKMSEAMDGRREAHMDVLVAVFGMACPTWRYHQPKQARARSK